jgi:hypothetical protein
MAAFDYTMTFETPCEAVALYDLKRLPVAGQRYYVGSRYADDGRKIRVFARQHVANGARFTFSERAEDCAA